MRKENNTASESQLLFNFWVIKIIISQSPSSIKKMDGRRSTHRKTKAFSLECVRDGQLFVPFRLVWSLSEKNSHTHTSTWKHTWVHAENKHACTHTCGHTVTCKHTHINLISEDLIAVMRWKHLHQTIGCSAAARLADQPGKCPIRRRDVSPEMLVNRRIGNQFTCAMRAGSNMEVNIYSFAWVKKEPTERCRCYWCACVITWFEMLFSLTVTAVG